MSLLLPAIKHCRNGPGALRCPLMYTKEALSSWASWPIPSTLPGGGQGSGAFSEPAGQAGVSSILSKSL